MYTPDNWVILRIEYPKELLYKILAGWGGGYLYGSSWQLNSGITRTEEDGDFILFHGYSGSIYRCHKDHEELRVNCSGILELIQKQYPDRVRVIEYTDFLKEFQPTS